MKTEVIKLYPDRDDVTLTTYLWDDSPELLDGRKRPGILICPGGGYMFCSDREAEPIALRFASFGYHAFVLRYSVYGEGSSHTMDPKDLTAPKPQVAHPHPVHELGMAMALIKRHSEEWLLDPDRVAICGFSAGGHNCAMYETCWHTPEMAQAVNATKEELRPAAAILSYPLIDGQKFNGVMGIAFLGTDTPDPALLEEVSPNLHVTKETPPTFLWGTSEDFLAADLLAMTSSLQKAGVPYEVHVFENGTHGSALADQATYHSPEQLQPASAQWPELAAAWLEKRFSLIDLF